MFCFYHKDYPFNTWREEYESCMYVEVYRAQEEEDVDVVY